MLNLDDEIIDSFDGSRYEITSLFLNGMIDAGFGINPRDVSPTIEGNDIETLRFEYDEGYSFADDLEAHFGEDWNNHLLIYVRDKKKDSDSTPLFSLIAKDNEMARKVSIALEKYFSGFRVSCQQFVTKDKKFWI